MSISFTCASPVIPGRAARTPRFSRSSISSSWLNKQGRGPTRLISPFITFHSCGSSSSLVFRRKLPNGVIASALAKWLATDAVPFFMVLNLTRVKGFLFRPTRSCRKSGEPVSKKPITHRINKTGKPNTNPSREKKKSNRRIKIRSPNQNSGEAPLRQKGAAPSPTDFGLSKYPPAKSPVHVVLHPFCPASRLQTSTIQAEQQLNAQVSPWLYRSPEAIRWLKDRYHHQPGKPDLRRPGGQYR